MASIKQQVDRTTWIDLTDFNSWSGYFTGIQRVLYEYASRFEKKGARFFIYDAVGKRHIEVSFSFLDRISGTGLEETVTRRRKIKQLLGKPYYALSDEQKRYLKPLAAGVNRAVRSVLSRTIDAKTPNSPYRDYPTADFRSKDTVVLIGAGWNEAGSIEVLSQCREEIGFKLVQHINDILPIYQPQLFADELPKVFDPYIELAVRNADAVTVISKATKRDIEIFCEERKLKRPPIHIVRLGEDIPVTRSIKPEGLNIPDKFILSLGTFEIRKNYILLYQAAKLAQLEGKEFPNIVITGRKGWLTEDLAHVIERDPFTHGKIIWLRNASDEEVEWLHENCMFSVFPSLCEGWGLPIVESLQHGNMCLASSVSSMVEIGDGMVDYFSPYDPRSCMDKILQYTTDESYRDMNAKIKNEYKIYTWEDSFKSLVRILS